MLCLCEKACETLMLHFRATMSTVSSNFEILLQAIAQSQSIQYPVVRVCCTE